MTAKPGRPKRIVERLVESPVRRSFSSHRTLSMSRGGQGTLSPCGPCFVPPLLRQMTGDVAVRRLVPVVVATHEPVGGHHVIKLKKESYQGFFVCEAAEAVCLACRYLRKKIGHGTSLVRPKFGEKAVN